MDASGRLLNRNSIASLETIRSLLLSKDVAISDLQFLIDKNGRFVIADPGGLMRGSDTGGWSSRPAIFTDRQPHPRSQEKPRAAAELVRRSASPGRTGGDRLGELAPQLQPDGADHQRPPKAALHRD